MEINKFIAQIAEQYYDTSVEQFTAETEFRQFPEWSSMTGLCILTMIKDEYGFFLDPQEMKKCNTIQDLFDLVQSKL